SGTLAREGSSPSPTTPFRLTILRIVNPPLKRFGGWPPLRPLHDRVFRTGVKQESPATAAPSSRRVKQDPLPRGDRDRDQSELAVHTAGGLSTDRSRRRQESPRSRR